MTLRTLAAAALAATLPAAAPGAPPPGADVVPTTAFAFVSVKASALWDSDALKPGREALLKAEPRLLGEFEKVAGFGPADVERVTLFWPTIPLGGGDAPFAVVTTRTPYNEAKVLKALRARPTPPWGRPGAASAPPAAVQAEAKAAATPVPVVPPAPPKECGDDPCAAADDPPAAARADDGPAGADLFFLEGGPFPAVYLLDERSLLFVPEGGVYDERGPGLLAFVGQLLRRRADGPLAEALDLTAKHAVVAAAQVSQVESAFQGLPHAPAELVPFRSLLRARAGVVTADVADTAKVTVRLTFADAAAARRAEPVLATLLQLAGEGLSAVRKDAERDQSAAAVILPLIDLAAKAIEKAVVKADGAAVTAALEADVGPAVAKAVALAPQAVQAASERSRAMNNLKQIGLAIHNYHDANGHLPTDVVGADGKPLLSWRVQILPYIEQAPLYNQFDQTKPWDHPANMKLLAQMPEVFRVVGRDANEKGMTYLQMPSLDAPAEGIYPIKVRGRKATLATITDGTSNTLMVVEAADAVAWTKPADLPFDPKIPPKLGAPDRGRFLALFGDGSAREFYLKKLPAAVLRALLTANGGEAVPIPD